MQKFNACKKRDWLIHFFFSTSSLCMVAIWPVGPPNEMNPSFNQNRNASPNDGARCRSCVALASFILAEEMRGARQSIGNRESKFPDRQFLHAPSLSALDRFQCIRCAQTCRRRDRHRESFLQSSEWCCPGCGSFLPVFRRCSRRRDEKNRRRACRTRQPLG